MIKQVLLFNIISVVFECFSVCWKRELKGKRDFAVPAVIRPKSIPPFSYIEDDVEYSYSLRSELLVQNIPCVSAVTARYSCFSANPHCLDQRRRVF